MMSHQETLGHWVAPKGKVAIIASRFNHLVVDALLQGAKEGLERHGVQASQIHVVQTPGAFEIPLIAKKLAETNRYQGIIALGAVIRGATSHYDFVAGECASGISRVMLETGVPIAFGVLTTDTLEQALERAGTKAGNKGLDAAFTLLEMISLIESLKHDCT